jgi:RNA polymerase sigma factor (sigma-70 family)
MENLAPPEHDARVRLTHDQAQELVLRTVATQAESLLRTAYRHSLCADDAHDAYQRGMEIFLRRARTLDPTSAHKWLHVVVKREAMEVRRGRTDAIGYEEVDPDRHASATTSSPEERVLSADRTTRAAEALRRLKPQELRAMWLKAMGHSYAEISEVTGYSATKVNRCLAEGRKSFLERFEGIEAGVECERWQPVLSAMVDGEATAAQITDARPHLRNCPACRATLRGLHGSGRPLAAVLPVGLMGAAGKLSGLVERMLPGAAGVGGDAGAATGGAGLLGLGGTKLAALLAAGAAATGGGVVAAQEVQHAHRAAATKAHTAAPKAPPRSGVAAANTAAPLAATARPSPVASSALRGGGASSAAKHRRHRVAVRRNATRARFEFAPRGAEPATARPSAPTARRATATPAPTPAPSTDTTRGEFAPQP